MATTKFYLDTRATKGRTPSPLKIAITKNGKTALLPLNVRLLPNQWDKVKCRVVNHQQRQMLNSFLTKRLLDVNAAIETLAEQGVTATLTATEIKNIIFAKFCGSRAIGCAPDKFLARMKKFGESRRKLRTRELYSATVTRISAFTPAANVLRFEDITPTWLSDFDKFLARTSPARNARNIHLRNIRAVFNDAIDDELTEYYPFRKFKIVAEPTRSRAMSVERLRALFNTPVEPWQQKYVDIFKLIFMLIGINAVDLYNAPALDCERLEYVRSKTSRKYSIKVEPEAREIIARYAGQQKLLAIAERHKSAKSFLMQLNRGLQSIEGYGDITTYWARHTWATIAAELDIPKETIAAALGHGGNTVTDIYICYDRRKVDAANRRVIDYVFNN